VERVAALALSSGSKVASTFSPSRLQQLRQPVAQDVAEARYRDQTQCRCDLRISVCDGYWSKLLNRSFSYENELELLFRDSIGVDYTLIDCGANFGYWSVLISSAPYGSHKAIAIEPFVAEFRQAGEQRRNQRRPI